MEKCLIFSPFSDFLDPKDGRKTNTTAHLINKAYVGDGEKKNKSQRSEKFGTDDILHLANCSEAQTSSDTDATDAFQFKCFRKRRLFSGQLCILIFLSLLIFSSTNVSATNDQPVPTSAAQY